MSFYTNVYYTGSSILLRQITDKKTEKARVNFSPSLFLISSKNSNFKTVDGRYADEITFTNVHEMNDFKKTYENVDNFEIHGDIDAKYQYISKEFGTECDYNFNDIGVMYIDMETTCENGFPSIENPEEKIIAITCSFKGKTYVYCLGDFTRDDANIIINEYHDEQQLLREFIHFMQDKQPEIITGWNVRFFDIPYLVNRCKKILDEKEVKNLSPWGIIKDSIVNSRGEDMILLEFLFWITMNFIEHSLM
jgi:DNA polymerase elongation subunit (family B)